MQEFTVVYGDSSIQEFTEVYREGTKWLEEIPDDQLVANAHNQSTNWSSVASFQGLQSF